MTSCNKYRIKELKTYLVRGSSWKYWNQINSMIKIDILAIIPDIKFCFKIKMDTKRSF